MHAALMVYGRGQALTVAAAGTVTEAVVPGAVVEVKVHFIGSQIYHHKFDICDELGKLGYKCPLAPGHYSFNKTFDVPKKAPHVSSSQSSDAIAFHSCLTMISIGDISLVRGCQASEWRCHHLH